MSGYEMVAKYDTVSDLALPMKALYQLASPSTPETAKQEAISRAEAGEPMTVNTVKEIVGRAKHDLDGCDAPSDDDFLEDRWGSKMAKYSIELPDHWEKHFSGWKKLNITREHVLLAEKAASTWESIAKTLEGMCNAVIGGAHLKPQSS